MKVSELLTAKQENVEAGERRDTAELNEGVGESEVSDGELRELASNALSGVEKQSSEILSGAEESIKTAGDNVGAAPETIATARAELALDSGLATLGREAKRLAEDAESEIRSVIGSESGGQDEITRHLGESQAAYFERASNLATVFLEKTRGKFFDPYRLREDDLTDNEKSYIAALMREVAHDDRQGIGEQEKRDTEKDLKIIEQSLSAHNFPVVSDYGKEASEAVFERTARRRKLFEVEGSKGSGKRESYWNTLYFPYDTKDTRAAAKDIFDGKTVVLLGGGHSRLREEMEQNDISPREVVNVDPFVSDPEPGADTVVPVSASDTGFIEALRQRGIVEADEILAEYSVPAYLETADEIAQMLRNIDSLLAEGGFARI